MIMPWRGRGTQHRIRHLAGEAAVKIRPLHDRVLVRRVEAEEKTAKGLYLPSAAQEKPRKGKVIALGQGRYLENGKRSKST